MRKLILSIVAVMASVTLWAQDLTALYNEGAAAFGKKDFVTAIAKFAEVVELGEDSEDAEELVGNAGKNLSICYLKMAVANARDQKFDDALSTCDKGIAVSQKHNKVQVNKFKALIASVCQAKGAALLNEKNYEEAAKTLAQGLECRPSNVKLQSLLARCYCDSDKFVEGMELYEQVAKNDNPKYAADVEAAKKDMALYTNNQIAKMQQAGDFDGMLAMAESMLAKNAESALGMNIRLQAYNGKKDFNKVIELAEATAAAQVEAEDKSQIYFLLGMAYNEKKMPEQAVAAFSKVTAGPNVQNAQAAIAGLKK